MSEDCPAGYYCIAGTSRSTRNINRCPEGTFCFTKTESKDQAILNPCPAGRYCASATGATTQGYDDCKNTINCNIGVACEPGKYCLKGYANMTTCPTGTTSSSGAKSVKECFRDVLKFYDVRIITTHEAYPKFIVEANSYHEFTLDFKHAYTDATLPNDLQQTTIITPIDENGRILSDVDKSTRVMIISHKSYSAKQSIPLNNDQS